MGIIDNIKTAAGMSPATPPAEAQPQLPQKKVLIVEDEVALGEAIAMKLKAENYEVMRVENGFTALKTLETFKADLILLDLSMPIMDGKTMLSKLREIPSLKDIPVVILTNSGTVEDIHDTQSSQGAVEFLIKSNISLQEIANKVKAHLPNS